MISPERKRLVIYTILLGGYDFLREPSVVTPDCDYICFTDDPALKSDVWRFVDISRDKGELSQNKWSRKYKILAHRYLSRYDASLYVDSNVRLIGNIWDYIGEYPNAKLLCLKHPQRDCIYSEADTCIACKKDSEDLIRSQVEQYRSEGYPPHNGLIVGNVIYRVHNDPEVVDLMETWWSELVRNSCRDQLCFNYACWKRGMSYTESNYEPWESPYWINCGEHFVTLDQAERKILKTIQAYVHLERTFQATEKALDGTREQLRRVSNLPEIQAEELHSIKESRSYKLALKLSKAWNWVKKAIPGI